MKLIVVTGGIGSGKSEVCRIMRESGLTAQYDADDRVKKLYHEDPLLLSSIEDVLGMRLRDEDGKFVPRLLAARIFNDASALQEVERLVFPALLKDFKAFVGSHIDEKYVIFESATILEKEFFNGFGDYTILVDAPFDVRLERAAARDGVERDAVIKRMNNQRLMNLLSEGHTDPRIDFIILNNGSRDELELKVKELLTEKL